jgi:RNA polymerase sigma-70 factor, ECF subfamily
LRSDSPFPVQHGIDRSTGLTGWTVPRRELYAAYTNTTISSATKGVPVKTDVSSIAAGESDIDLVRKAQQGDADAFAGLFNAYKSKIYALCLRMTSNTTEAEDLTQDAFLQAFRRLTTFRGDSAFSTWLYRLAVNTVLMHFRKKGPRQVSLDQTGTDEVPTAKREYGRLDQQLLSSVDRITLARALRDLPAGYRNIFVLHEIQGYEHQEIARLLHCSVGNSKSQLHKAKLRMRDILYNHTAREPRRLIVRSRNEVGLASPRLAAESAAAVMWSSPGCLPLGSELAGQSEVA